MPRIAKELSALVVGKIKSSGWTAVGGVPGLGLQVAGESKSWVLRLSIGGRRPEMGLGPYPEVSLAMARSRAAVERAKVRQGINPIDAMRSMRRAEAAARRGRRAGRRHIAPQVRLGHRIAIIHHAASPPAMYSWSMRGNGSLPSAASKVRRRL